MCKEKGCDRKVVAKGYCHKHYYFYYKREKKNIPLDWPYNQKFHVKHCLVQDCNRKPQKNETYCNYHKHRLENNLSLDAPAGVLRKAEKNGNWKGGIADYPNHTIMKKQRIIKLTQQNNKCELCGDKAYKIHHKDENKANHNLDNLIVVCDSCHGKLHRGQIKQSK
jgi:hypothetical protein